MAFLRQFVQIPLGNARGQLRVHSLRNKIFSGLLDGSNTCDKWVKNLFNVVIGDALDGESFTEDLGNEFVDSNRGLTKPFKYRFISNGKVTNGDVSVHVVEDGLDLAKAAASVGLVA